MRMISLVSREFAYAQGRRGVYLSTRIGIPGSLAGQGARMQSGPRAGNRERARTPPARVRETSRANIPRDEKTASPPQIVVNVVFRRQPGVPCAARKTGGIDSRL